MKKCIILTTFLLLTILQMVAQNTSLKGTITLSHQGKETEYAYNKMANVIDAAEDGDTILLSAGYFEGDFYLTKKLSFIGVGADSNNNWKNCTCYKGSIYINLKDSTKLTARLFDGIYFCDGGINFKSAIDNVIFRKCHWENELSFYADVNYILADRCYCQLYTYSSHLKQVVARNCYVIGTPYNNLDPSSAQFYNCNVRAQNSHGLNNNKTHAGFIGTYYNCILSCSQDYFIDPTGSNGYAILVNCLYKQKENVDSRCSTMSCYKDNSDKEVFDFTKEELLQNNYLGTDGTIVGYYGGKNPYTLSFASWNISNKIHLDKEKKQVQFNMNITQQQ